MASAYGTSGLATPSPRPAREPGQDFAENPGCCLSASGLDVGLPEGQMATPRWGTPTSRRPVVFQDLPRISRAIEDGSFFENAAYIEAMDDCKERTVHST